MTTDLKYKSKGDACKSKAWELYNKKHYTKAIKEYEECLKWFKRAAKWRGIYNKHVGDILGQLGECYKMKGYEQKEAQKPDAAKRDFEEALKCYREAKKHYYDATRDPDARNVSQFERNMEFNIKKCENLIHIIERGGADAFKEYVPPTRQAVIPEIPEQPRSEPVFLPVEPPEAPERKPVAESHPPVARPPVTPPTPPAPPKHEEERCEEDIEDLGSITSRLSDLVDKINAIEKITKNETGDEVPTQLPSFSPEKGPEEEQEPGLLKENEWEHQVGPGQAPEEPANEDECHQQAAPAPVTPPSQPQKADPSFAIGKQYLKFNKYQDALKHFENALRVNPSDGEIQRMADECRSHLQGNVS